ncbi:MAG: nucleotide exchange factor GrpE [Porticoccaceae bacterium]|nr:nucleotide exchange factor GrpE [Porticoccaceae bacterium]
MSANDEPQTKETEQKESGVSSEKETPNQSTEESVSAASEPEELIPEQTTEQQMEELQEKLRQAEEDVLRVKAQEQNSLRRAALDVEKARKFALESFVKELLPVVDNLERALASADSDQENTEAVVEGVELTLKSLLSALEKNNVQPLDPAGEPFNPEQHQAMASVENAEVEANTVVEVFQKGYELNGRLIRPAMVVVSKTG